MSLQKRRSNPIHYNGIDFRWSVSVRTLSSPGEGLLVVQSERGQRLVVRLALNDLWIHGPGTRNSVKPALVRRVMEEACALGWTPGAPGPEFNAMLDDEDCLSDTRSVGPRSDVVPKNSGNNRVHPSTRIGRS